MFYDEFLTEDEIADALHQDVSTIKYIIEHA